MLGTISRNWWLLALRGVLAIIFGVIAIAKPDIAILTLVLIFGAYAFVDGVFAIGAAVMGGGAEGRWLPLLIEGVLGILVGLIVFFWPGLTALVIIYFIAGWALLTGLLEIVAAIQLRREIDNEWMLILGGLLSVVFGVLLILSPAGGLIALTILMGVYAIIFGVLMIVLGLRVKGMAGTLSTT